ncbi:MAG: hypothetical protein ACREMS_11065 [Gemmatimonadaceae bacterium]
MPNDDPGNDQPQGKNRPNQDSASRRGWKSKWVESTAASADDPMSPEEMQGHNLLGNSSLRDGAIRGVSDPARDGHGAPGEQPADVTVGPRVNPPGRDDVPGEGGSETTGT